VVRLRQLLLLLLLLPLSQIWLLPLPRLPLLPRDNFLARTLEPRLLTLVAPAHDIGDHPTTQCVRSVSVSAPSDPAGHPHLRAVWIAWQFLPHSLLARLEVAPLALVTAPVFRARLPYLDRTRRRVAITVESHGLLERQGLR
jgi:hypothetical protein